MSDLNQQFIQCSRNGDISEMEKLLLRGADINSLENGENALLAAVKQNHHNVVKFLIDKGADVNALDSENKTALFHASASLKNETLKVLLESGAQANVTDLYRRSPLYTACGKGNVEAVKLLLSHDAYIDVADTDGKSALDHKACIDLQDKNGNTALMHSCIVGEINVAQVLLEGGAQVNLQNEDGKTALMLATENRRIVIVILLLKHGADINLQDNNGTSSLMLSISSSVIIFNLLLENGAKMDLQDRKGRSALMKLYLCGKVNSHHLIPLLKSRPNVNLQDIEGKSALMMACQEESVQDIRQLLACDPELNLQDKEGWSALMRAVESKGTLKVEQLMECGALLNLQNNEGLTAMMIASRKYEARDVEKHSLFHASEHGNIDVVRNLIKHISGMLNLQDDKGRTSLMLACQNGHTELVSFLLDSGADMRIQNNHGLSAVDIALNSDNTDIRQEFIKLRTMRSFPGILFLEGVKRETLTSSAKDINLEHVGIALSIPEGALSSTDPPLDVQIQTCFSGSWDMPENLELVSPAYIVKPSRKVAFKKEVLVKIWHHANLETEEDCADMEFLSAKTIPEYREGSPVYVFQEITGVKGSFRPREEQPAGEIAVKHFCILGIFRRVFKGNQNADGK